MTETQTLNNPRNQKKIISIILDVLSYVFFAVCIIALIFSIVAKKNSDGAVEFGKYQFRLVLTNSMEKSEKTDVSSYDIKDIPVNSLLTIESVPDDPAEAEAFYASIKNGDVLTFRYVYTKQETITHRVVGDPVKKADGGYIIHLEGDNKAANANTLVQTIDTSLVNSPNYVLGRVVAQNYPIGLFLTILKKPVGIICTMIIPALIIAILEVIRLVNILTESKRQKAKEEAAAKDAELEEMRRQLEALKAEKAADADTTEE